MNHPAFSNGWNHPSCCCSLSLGFSWNDLQLCELKQVWMISPTRNLDSGIHPNGDTLSATMLGMQEVSLNWATSPPEWHTNTHTHTHDKLDVGLVAPGSTCCWYVQEDLVNYMYLYITNWTICYLPFCTWSRSSYWYKGMSKEGHGWTERLQR